MTQSTIKNAIDKWSSLIDKSLPEYSESCDSNIYTIAHSPLFPLAKKIVAKTVGLDLVSINPLPSPGGVSKSEMDRIEAEIKQENRDSKIDAVIEGKEYKEKKVKDHPDYKKVGGNPLLYFDFEYKSENKNNK